MTTRAVKAAQVTEPALAPLGEEVFRLLFERSSDAILLFDSRISTFIDCNAAAVQMLRRRSKHGGTIELRSELGKRTRVTVRLTLFKVARGRRLKSKAGERK